MRAFLLMNTRTAYTLQHRIICALVKLLPCCIFGDPLQAIFEFRMSTPPPWNIVLDTFPVIAELRQPHRWDRVGNPRLGSWLLRCRDELTTTGQLDLTTGPAALQHWPLTATNDNERYREKIRLLLRALDKPAGERCIIIGDSQNESGRAALARNVKAATIEPVACKTLAKFVDKLNNTTGKARLNLILDLIKGVMLDADVASLKKVAISVIEGKRRKPIDGVQQACVEIIGSQDLRHILVLLEEIPKSRKGWIYRRELHSALRSGLRAVITGTNTRLEDALWDVQNRRRHSGRRFGDRNVGSTLLVKGLEFDHAIIVDPERLKTNDLYVALTRGSRTVTVISGAAVLRPNNPN